MTDPGTLWAKDRAHPRGAAIATAPTLFVLKLTTKLVLTAGPHAQIGNQTYRATA